MSACKQTGSIPLVSLVNLGCPKNTVDSEGLLAGMSLAGFRFVEDPLEADVCLVNTCGFLDAARQEAQEVLEGLAAARGRRTRPILVATGCAVERAGGAPELDDGFLDAADLRVGFADYPRLPEICLGQLAVRPAKGYAGPHALPAAYIRWLSQPRMRIGAPWSAWLKLGEGCSNCCAYCAIPLIRGRRVSRPAAALLREAQQLVESGAREINLIAQDVTAYGLDALAAGGALPKHRPFAALVTEMLRCLPTSGIWLRVLYAHPRHLSNEILDVLASDPRICPYLDLPLQHVDSRVLRLMGRGYDRKRVDRLLAALRRRWPQMALRSTFIVGHPGETPQAFQTLLDFVREGHIDHLGVFEWSPEPGTRSMDLRAIRVDPQQASERRQQLMEAQQAVSHRRLLARKGRVTEFLAERREGGHWVGRTPFQAPDIDGETRLDSSSPGTPPLHAGDLIPVRLTGSTAYDLTATRLKFKA